MNTKRIMLMQYNTRAAVEQAKRTLTKKFEGREFDILTMPRTFDISLKYRMLPAPSEIRAMRMEAAKCRRTVSSYI